MKLFTRSRVVKSNAVEVCVPRLVESQFEEFSFLGQHLSIVRDTAGESADTDGSNIFEMNGFAYGEKVQSFKQDNLKPQDENARRIMNEAEAKAQKIIAQAEKTLAQAEEALAKAKEEAQKVQDAARLEAEEFRSKLHAEVSQLAYQEGHAQGLSQGIQKGLEQGTQEANKLKAEANALFELAEHAVEDELTKVDETLLRLALKVAERIVRANLEHNPHYLLKRIRALTLLPERREGWQLHVAPDDAEWLKNLPPEERLKFPYTADEALRPGDCYLECSEGIFDARLEAQLDRFEHLLREELKHDRLEQAGR